MNRCRLDPWAPYERSAGDPASDVRIHRDLRCDSGLVFLADVDVDVAAKQKSHPKVAFSHPAEAGHPCIESLSLSMHRPDGAPGRIRTSDPQVRSLVLYPAELRAPSQSKNYDVRFTVRQRFSLRSLLFSIAAANAAVLLAETE